MNAPSFPTGAASPPAARTDRSSGIAAGRVAAPPHAGRTAAAFGAACTVQSRLATPLGELLLARTPRGLAGVWFAGQKDHPGVLPAPQAADDALLAGVAGRLADYFLGRAARFDDVPLDLVGTPFQRAVWQALAGVGRGSVASYGDIARRIGRPAAVRAVGAAIGRNPVSVIVPCHRVLGANGRLTGYAGGLDRKAALLRLEGVATAG